MRTRREVLVGTAAMLAAPAEGPCSSRAAQAQAARHQRLRRLADRVPAPELFQRLREGDRHQDRRHQPDRLRQAARDGRERQRRLEHHGDRRPGRLPRDADGPGRADRCQDRRPQQVPAAGADEPRVLAQLLLDGDRLSAGCISQRRAEVLGGFLGRQGVPRPAQPAQSPGRQSRGGADGRRRGAGQALSASMSIAPSRSSTRSTSTSMSGGPRDSSRRSCSSTRRWCWRPVGTGASTT